MDRSKQRTSSPEVEAATKQQIVRASPFADLPSPSRDALFEIGRVELYPRRHRLADQGEPPRCLFLLGAGRVKLERVSADRVFPLGHRGPGQIVGEAVVAGAAGANENAYVVDEVEAVALPMAGVRKLLLLDAALRAAMSAALLEQQRTTERRLASLLLHGVEARLVSFLLESASRWGRTHDGGELIAAPFTHADIALLIGSTRETVTLLLGKLKRAGLIGFDRRRVLIRDRAGLARYVAAL